jgi:SAM-dependent methyltransferase
MRHQGHDVIPLGEAKSEDTTSSLYRLLCLYFLNYLSKMLPDKPTDEFFREQSLSLNDQDLETTCCPLCKSSSTSIIHIRKPFAVVLCSGCGLAYLNPRLKESFIKRIYEGKSYFSEGEMTGYKDYISQERSLRITFRKFLSELKRAGFTSDRLLEVGCGYGYFLDEARVISPFLFGTELSPEAAAHARKLPGVEIHTGDMDSLPAGWDNFDITITINVIEHIYAPLEFIIALKQTLKERGRIVVATPDFGSFWYKILGGNWPSFKIPEHVAFYTSKTLRHLLKKAGFRDIREIPFRHVFPVCVVTGKFGLNIGGRLGQIPVSIPKTMIALTGQK